jgi:hypothetical protein
MNVVDVVTVALIVVVIPGVVVPITDDGMLTSAELLYGALGELWYGTMVVL